MSSIPKPGASWARVASVVALLTALTSALLVAFAFPPANSRPHDVPVLVVGDSQDRRALERRLDEVVPDGFRVRATTSEEHAARQVLDREVYGAIAINNDGAPSRLLVATAASPSVAREIEDASRRAGNGQQMSVDDLRPLPADDPGGAGLAAGALPLALGGWIAAVVLLMFVPDPRRRALGAFAFAAIGGACLTAIMQWAIGAFDGNYWRTAAAATLGICASAWAILGLRVALGNAGLALGATVLVVLGNPLSGLSGAPELLPTGWGALGQMLPPGATGSLLRSTAYFDGAGGLSPTLVLFAWLAGGIVLYVIGSRRAANQASARPIEESAPVAV